MSVATAIVGGAVVGAYASNRAAKESGKAAQRGAQASADATLQATQLQIEEIRRQFDYQQRVIQPMLQQQYDAQGAFSQIMGYQNPANVATNNPFSNEQWNYILQEHERNQAEQAANPPPEAPDAASWWANNTGGSWQERLQEWNAIQQQYEQDLAAYEAGQPSGGSGGAAGGPPTLGQEGYRGRMNYYYEPNRGPNGEFIDPNLDPTQLADINTYGDTVRDNLLAGTDAGADELINYVNRNSLVADSPEEDARFQRARDVTLTGARGGDLLMDRRGGENIADGAAGTGVYGDTFEESTGYNWMREEMQRELDRKNSAGGNYGGRAIMEAQRRAKGLADAEYYNWAAGRERDLSRLGAAEAADIMRRDQFAGADVARLDEFAGRDIARGDIALDTYERGRQADVGREDQAYYNYLQRRAGDAARLDDAAIQEDRLLATDLQRRDQGYYNYLNNLRAASGFGDASSQAVQSSQAAAGGVAGAYGQQGADLSRTYNMLGQTQANISADEWANYNAIAQGGINNYLFSQWAGL